MCFNCQGSLEIPIRADEQKTGAALQVWWFQPDLTWHHGPEGERTLNQALAAMSLCGLFHTTLRDAVPTQPS